MKAITQSDKYNEYDRILEACINNIVITAKEKHNNIIYIDKFNINSIEDLLYLEMCNIIQMLYGYPIYIEINLIDYIKLKVKNKKKNLQIKKVKKSCESGRKKMMESVINDFKKNNIVYKHIYNAYYNIKKEGI